MRSLRSAVSIVLVACLSLGLAACIERKPKATTTADDPAGRAQCFQNQQAVESAVQGQMINQGKDMPRNYGEVKAKGFLAELLWCPAGGDMIWVPTEGGFMDCSVHGRWQDAPAQ